MFLQFHLSKISNAALSTIVPTSQLPLSQGQHEWTQRAIRHLASPVHLGRTWWAPSASRYETDQCVLSTSVQKGTQTERECIFAWVSFRVCNTLASSRWCIHTANIISGAEREITKTFSKQCEVPTQRILNCRMLMTLLQAIDSPSPNLLYYIFLFCWVHRFFCNASFFLRLTGRHPAVTYIR